MPIGSQRQGASELLDLYLASRSLRGLSAHRRGKAGDQDSQFAHLLVERCHLRAVVFRKRRCITVVCHCSAVPDGLSGQTHFWPRTGLGPVSRRRLRPNVSWCGTAVPPVLFTCGCGLRIIHGLIRHTPVCGDGRESGSTRVLAPGSMLQWDGEWGCLVGDVSLTCKLYLSRYSKMMHHWWVVGIGTDF